MVLGSARRLDGIGERDAESLYDAWRAEGGSVEASSLLTEAVASDMAGWAVTALLVFAIRRRAAA